MRLILGVLVFCTCLNLAKQADAQFGTDDVIISEFFDDILRVNQGSVTPLFSIPESLNDNITHITIADASTAYVVNFTDIWKIDTGANSVTTFATVPGVSPSEIKIDTDGNLVVSAADEGVTRINTTTGITSTVYDGTFFNPTDIAISDTGDIYATEFFDGLGRIDTNGNWQQLGNWDTNFFQRIDIGADGFLYLATTFEDGDIYRVHPNTGAGEIVLENAYTFIDDLEVASNGLIYIAGNADFDGDMLAEDVVFTIDPLTGQRSVVVDENMVGNPSPPFFNPQDIEINNGFFAVVPEPGSAIILAGLGIGIITRRRR